MQKSVPLFYSNGGITAMRKLPTTEVHSMTTFLLPDRLNREARIQAAKMQVSRAQLFRLAIEEFVSQAEEDVKREKEMS